MARERIELDTVSSFRGQVEAMRAQLGKNNPVKFSEAKNHYVRCWSDIASHLPNDFKPRYNDFVRGYFRAQLRVAKGQRVRAREIFKGLDRRRGFKEFEKDNQSLLAAIDIVVTGKSNRSDDLKRPIEPLFRI